MKKRTIIVAIAVAAISILQIVTGEDKSMNSTPSGKLMIYDSKAQGLVETERIELSDADWKKQLPPETYQVMRQHGTERPFSCGILKDMGEGTYTCAACGLELFVSKHKFDSGTGWPSFFDPIHPNNIGTKTDYLMGKHYPRTEVHCARCGGHLGHVFEDGPKPTGLRYCMNGVSMNFVPAKSNPE